MVLAATTAITIGIKGSAVRLNIFGFLLRLSTAQAVIALACPGPLQRRSPASCSAIRAGSQASDVQAQSAFP
jgi:hypothetical protein